MTKTTRFQELRFEEVKLLEIEAPRMSRYLVINEDGDVMPKTNIQPGIPRVLLFMLGKILAKMLGFNTESTVTRGDISVLTNLKGEELSKLLEANPFIVYVAHGRYRINTWFLSQILDELEKLYTSSSNSDTVMG